MLLNNLEGTSQCVAKETHNNDDFDSLAGEPQVLTGFGGPMSTTSWNTVANAVNCGNGAARRLCVVLIHQYHV